MTAAEPVYSTCKYTTTGGVMQAPRNIGIDLHRNQFTCCVRLENGRNYLTDWKLEDLPRFVKKLRPSDEIAVGGNREHAVIP